MGDPPSHAERRPPAPASRAPAGGCALLATLLLLTHAACNGPAEHAATPPGGGGGVHDATPAQAEPDAGTPDAGPRPGRDAGPGDAGVDERAHLRERLLETGVLTPRPPPPPPAPLVELGRALFFDKVLSGRRDIACATCHLASQGTSDGLALSFGTGSRGAGPERTLGERGLLVPRNALDLFNRGLMRNQPLMWDGRVGSTLEAQSPELPPRPPGLRDNLAMQALLPLLAREEMRGLPDELGATGEPNELGDLPDDAPERVWEAVVTRVLAIAGYVRLLRAAYPDVEGSRFGIHHLVNALSAWEEASLTFVHAPLDDFLAGDDRALSDAAVRGGILFIGKGNCLACHRGPLLSNFRNTHVGSPQLGPGRGAAAPLDLGAAAHSGLAEDRFSFRTPPLRNVELTAPYMHDGAYATLEAVVRHYNDIPRALQAYDASQLPPFLRDTVQRDPALLAELADGVDGLARTPRGLTDEELADLVAFLRALTDPAARDLSHLVPERVPSGLPVSD